MEEEIHNMQEVAAVAEQAEQFCLRHGQSPKVSNHIALCIEEMAGNIIRHGFSMDDKKHHLSVRVLYKKDQWILRFRDDCGPFDPVRYVPAEGADAIGIRLAMTLAKEANYTNSLNLNNLTLKLSGE